MLALVGEVLGPRFHGHLQYPVFLEGAGYGQNSFSLELPAHRAGLGHRATTFGEDVAYLRAGAVPVVREALHDHRHPVRGIALIGDRLIPHTFELARTCLLYTSDAADESQGVDNS